MCPCEPDSPRFIDLPVEADDPVPPAEWPDVAAHERWCRKWNPPCPDGHPRRLRRAIGHRERSIEELELRVPLASGEGGVCQVITDEREDRVYVRVLVCYDEEDWIPIDEREWCDCPVRVWLDAPLGERLVIDVDSGEPLPLHQPCSE